MAEKKDDKKAVKLKQKTSISYFESGGKAQLIIGSVDKKGEITQIKKMDEDAKDGGALKELKKFVNSL